MYIVHVHAYGMCEQFALYQYTYLFYNHSIQPSSGSSVSVPKAVADWEKKRGEYQRQLDPLVAAIKGSSIDPISLDCTQDSTKLTETAVQRMESERYARLHVHVHVYVYCSTLRLPTCTCR